jgi:hypothetical protein
MSAKQAGATSLGMASENFGYSHVRLRRIKKIQFGVVDPNELVSCYICYDDHLKRNGIFACLCLDNGPLSLMFFFRLLLSPFYLHLLSLF